MLHPVLTLLVASSLQAAADSPRQLELAQLAVEIARAVELPQVPAGTPAEAPTFREVAYSFDPLAPAPSPSVPTIVSYDWRTPVVFDLP
jgi:hypothetical protein